MDGTGIWSTHLRYGDRGQITESVDHVCIQVIRADDQFPRDEWRRLAPVLAGR